MPHRIVLDQRELSTLFPPRPRGVQELPKVDDLSEFETLLPDEVLVNTARRELANLFDMFDGETLSLDDID